MKDSRGRPIAEATVTLNSATRTTTDDDGYYAFSVQKAGSYRLTVSRAGFRFTPRQVRVTVRSSNVRQDFRGERVAATPQPASTSAPPLSARPRATATPRKTSTPNPSLTATPRATRTPTAPATATATARPSNTPTAQPSPTAPGSPTPTATLPPTSTPTPVDTATPVPTETATPLPTASPTPSATSPPSPTVPPTPPPTSTPLPSPTVPIPSDGTTFNVRDFGARGDGRAEDTAALQSAIDAAAPVRGVVRIPSGSYLTGALNVPSGVTILGDGWSSVLLARDNIGDHLISPQDYQTTTVTDVTIRDLKLVGRSAAQNGGGPMPRLTDSKHGIAIIGGQRWTVDHVWVEDFDGDGIYVGRPNILNSPAPADNNIIIDCVVKWNVRNGMMISDGTGNIIRRAIFESNQVGMDPSSPKYSPDMYSSAELDLEPNNPGQRVSFNIIEDSTFRNGNWNAIQITRPGSGFDESWNVIRNNTFIDNRNVQVYIISEVATANVISGNRFIATSPDRVKMHVRVAMGSDNRIEGNYFQGGTSGRDSSRAAQVDSAGKIYWPERTVLRNNVIDLSGGQGDGTEVLIARETKGNIVENNTLINAYLTIQAS